MDEGKEVILRIFAESSKDKETGESRNEGLYDAGESGAAVTMVFEATAAEYTTLISFFHNKQHLTTQS
jgi:hypothetical protein